MSELERIRNKYFLRTEELSDLIKKNKEKLGYIYYLKREKQYEEEDPDRTLTGDGIKVYYTNQNNLVKRLKVLLGQLQAGNNNPNILNEINEISMKLYKGGNITKTNYHKFLKQFI